MNLQEQTYRIKQVMGIRESSFLKRRVTPEHLEQAFIEALEYMLSMQDQTRKRYDRDQPLTQFGYKVLSMMMDDIHPNLIQDNEEFPYEEIWKYIHDLYYDRIVRAYEENITN